MQVGEVVKKNGENAMHIPSFKDQILRVPSMETEIFLKN
jgi:hypothetical protein